MLSSASIIAIKLLDDNPLCRLLFYYLRLKGVHIKEKAALLSTAHTEEDLEFTYQAFEESIREMQTAGFFKITLAEAEDHHAITPSPEPLPSPKSKIHNQGEKKKVELTPGQQEIWVEQQLGKNAAAAYNLGCELHFNGKLQVENLELAIQQLIDRHEALRASFSIEETVQQIHAKRELELAVFDLSTFDSAKQENHLQQLRHTEAETPFDIFREVPYRFQLVKLSDAAHYLFFTAHHIIADGWSMGILLHDLAKLYTGISSNHPPELSEVHQLSTFAAAQQQIQNSAAQQDAENYWLSQFSDDPPVLTFPTDRLRPSVKTYGAQLEKRKIPASLFQDLKATATAEGNTFFNLIYTAFQVFVHRLAQQEDFVLGITAAAQASSENPNLVTHGVNLLPVRLRTNGLHSFSETLQATRNTLLDAFDHQELTFGHLVQKLQLPRDPSRQPLISILFNMDSPVGELVFSDLQVQQTAIPRNYETFDCFINIKPLDDTFVVEWIYNTDLFHAETIRRRLEEFQTLLESIVANPQEKIAYLNLLPDNERQQLLQEWNGTAATYPQDVCIHQLFEQQAAKTPKRIALRDKSGQLTYDELNQRANQVAHYLIAHGVNTGMFVGVYFERCVEMVVSLLACMKVGAIYVPLDPLNPKERLAVILEDAQADYLITHQPLMDQLPDDFDQVICWEKAMPRIRAASTGNLYKHLQADHLVYVNYTSGSTGKPKGVLIPHYAVIDHHYAIIKALNLGADEVIFSVASIAFDPSVQDFFLPLLLGASVYLADEPTKTDGFLLQQTLQEIRPTLMQATPSTWRMLLLAGWTGNEELTILCGGEGLTKDLADKLIQRSHALYNIYGPTETTIWSTLKKLEGDRQATRMETAYEPIGPADPKCGSLPTG